MSPSLAAAARASILHCKDLAANVMDVAKFNSGELVLAQEDVDVRALCEEVHQTMSIAYPVGDDGDEGDAGRPAAAAPSLQEVPKRQPQAEGPRSEQRVRDRRLRAGGRKPSVESRKALAAPRDSPARRLSRKHR